MELAEIQELITAQNGKELIAKIKAAAPVAFDADARLKEYEPEGHEVFDRQKRKDKTVLKPTGTFDSNNNEITRTEIEPVTRIGFPGQKLIVSRRVMFMVGGGVELEAQPASPDETRLYDMFLKAAEDNKLDYRYGPIAKTMMAEGECAALFYMQKPKDKEDEEKAKDFWGKLGNSSTVLRPRMVLLKPSEGNEFYPVFDVYKNMVAFGRAYKVEDKEWFDLYTATEHYQYKEGVLQEPVEGTRVHGFDKIPVAYFAQERTEWQDVQQAIDRLEKVMSNHGDTNDYNGSPMILAKGEIKGFASKGETGKILEMGEGADAEYLDWKGAPESIKLEIENLFKIIYSVSQTPDISFEQMSGIGAISGTALRLMFMDAHAAAKEKQDGAYGESVQRMVNILKAGIVAVDKKLAKAANLHIKVVFNTYIPRNEAEELDNEYKQINNLVTAVQGGLLSRKTALNHMPFIENLKDEEKAINEQITAEKVTLEI